MIPNAKWRTLVVAAEPAYKTPAGTAFGERLYAHRKAAGLSQAKLAATTGWMTHSYISRIESGERLPGVTTITALVAALDLGPDDAMEMYRAAGVVEVIQAALTQMPPEVRLRIAAGVAA